VPDQAGETKAQGPSMGLGIDLLSGNQAEIERLNITSSLKSGSLPRKSREVLISRTFAEKLDLKIGDTLTLVSSTMYGELALYNFILCGTIEFGTTALDRGTLIADIQDVRDALNMADASGEILGFSRSGRYDNAEASLLSTTFNERYSSEQDEFSLIMKSLAMQNNMGFLIEYSGKLQGILVFVFIVAMSLILWNAGLLGGLRRYGEFGMRLAIGEEKNHVYKTMLLESMIIGFLGSIAGVIAGISISFYLQTYGIDLGSMMKNASIMMSQVFRAQITTTTLYLGFVP